MNRRSIAIMLAVLALGAAGAYWAGYEIDLRQASADREVSPEPIQPRGKGIESPDYIWNDAEVKALEYDGDTARGKQLFQIEHHCHVCHSNNGAGNPEESIPKIAGQYFTVVVKQIADIRAGRRDTQIGTRAKLHLASPRDIADVAAYIASLPRQLGSRHGPGTNLELGEKLVRRDCTSCHRRGGQGIGERFYPIVGGQYYNYLIDQLRDMALGRRRNALPKMMKIVQAYPDEHLIAVADHLSRLEWPEKEE